MNNTSAKAVREKIVDLIRQQDGKLGWHEIAAEVGADTLAIRTHIFAEVRALEHRGIIRRQHGEGDSRYWIV